MDSIKDKNFTVNTSESLGFGYSPSMHVWVKFTLSNTSSATIHKTLEYDNPLTSYIALYDARTSALLEKNGVHVPHKDKIFITTSLSIF